MEGGRSERASILQALYDSLMLWYLSPLPPSLPPSTPPDFLGTPPSLNKFFAHALQPTPEMNTYLPKPLAVYPDMLPAIIEEEVADAERHTVYWYYAMVTLVGQGGREGGRIGGRKEINGVLRLKADAYHLHIIPL